MMSLLTLLGVPLNYGIKEIYDRPRPDAAIVQVLGPTFGDSFPSGHAMASTMLYGFLAFMVWLHVPQSKRRMVGTIGFALVAVMVSLSRIYLGAHWLSDVMAGWAAGLFFLFLFAEYYKRTNREPFAPGAEE
jgi:undecaprenyl-diphosphatase